MVIWANYRKATESKCAIARLVVCMYGLASDFWIEVGPRFGNDLGLESVIEAQKAYCPGNWHWIQCAARVDSLCGSISHDVACCSDENQSFVLCPHSQVELRVGFQRKWVKIPCFHQWVCCNPSG